MPYTDYDLHFSICDEVKLYFIHVRSLSHPDIAAAVAAGNCPASGAARQYQECRLNVDISLQAGELIGTTGDLEASIYGIDVGLRDYRLATSRSAFAKPERWCEADSPQITERCYAACFFDYMESAAAAPYLELFAREDNNQTFQRTAAPVCGTVYLDVADTAQGYWFPSAETPPSEVDALYLGPNDYLPDKHAFSIGDEGGVLGVSSGVYSFQPLDFGYVNRRFGEIDDSQLYCFDTLYDSLYSLSNNLTAAAMDFRFILQLSSDGQTLALEKQRQLRDRPLGVHRPRHLLPLNAAGSASQGLEEVLQAVDLDFVNHAEHSTQLALGKALSGEPHHIGLRQVDKQALFVFAEWHAIARQSEQLFAIRRPGLRIIRQTGLPGSG